MKKHKNYDPPKKYNTDTINKSTLETLFPQKVGRYIRTNLADKIDLKEIFKEAEQIYDYHEHLTVASYMLSEIRTDQLPNEDLAFLVLIESYEDGAIEIALVVVEPNFIAVPSYSDTRIDWTYDNSIGAEVFTLNGLEDIQELSEFLLNQYGDNN